MGVDTVDLEEVVGFEFSDFVKEDDVESFFLFSVETSVVDGDSFDLNLKVQLKGKSKGSDGLLVLNFDLLDEDGSFSGDLDSDFFNSGDGFLFNSDGLNLNPVNPVDSDGVEFQFEFSDDFGFQSGEVSLPFESEESDGFFSFNLDLSGDNVDVVGHLNLVLVDSDVGITLEDEDLSINMSLPVFDSDIVVSLEVDLELVNQTFKSDGDFSSLFFEFKIEFDNKESDHFLVFSGDSDFHVGVFGKDINNGGIICYL